jgi:membrane-associated phospholipid phosphatase
MSTSEPQPRPAPAHSEHKYKAAYVGASEVIATSLIIIAAALAYSFPPQQGTNFIEGDPTLSHPLVAETVPTGALIALSVGVPLLVIAFVNILAAFQARKHHNMTRHEVARHVAYDLLALLQSIALALAITGAVKDFTSVLVRNHHNDARVCWWQNSLNSYDVQRPNFFALCNYAGYGTTGPSPQYFAQISPGQFGNINKCRGSASDIHSAMSAFPSGHASIAFAGLVIASILLWEMEPRLSLISMWGVVCVLPMILAAWIALTRIRNYYHTPAEVFVGVMVGVYSARAAWLNRRWHLLGHSSQ